MSMSAASSETQMPLCWELHRCTFEIILHSVIYYIFVVQEKKINCQQGKSKDFFFLNALDIYQAVEGE